MHNKERAERYQRVRNRLVAAFTTVILGSGLVLTASAPANAATVVTFKNSAGISVTRPILKYGMRNAYVTFVQTKLGVARTGYFGTMTQTAVKRWQLRRGLPVTGVVAQLTWTSFYAKASTSTSSPSGKFCPAPGAWLGSGWGDPRWHGPHQGIDMMGDRGDRILAVESGYVVRAGVLSTGQLRIVLQGKSGAKYYFGHNSRNLVVAGQRVTAGQQIATMGNTGTTAVHLHFEYWPSGGESAAVDPEPLVRSLC